MTEPIRVIIESPYKGNTDLNIAYLRACMRDSLLRGEAPFASHGLYTQPGVLVDDIPSDRALGIEAGFAWRASAAKTVFYTDLGWSGGMNYGRQHCERNGLPFECRGLPNQARLDSTPVALTGEALIKLACELDRMQRAVTAAFEAIPCDCFKGERHAHAIAVHKDDCPVARVINIASGLV
jgi:hypothetical protein